MGVIAPVHLKGVVSWDHCRSWKNTDYKKVFSEIGKEWSLTQEDRDTLEAFICAIYGKVHIQDVNMVRFIKINEVCSNKGQEALKNVDMASLPPCKRTLEQQLNRFNYQVTIWNWSHMPNPRIPDPPSTSVVWWGRNASTIDRCWSKFWK